MMGRGAATLSGWNLQAFLVYIVPEVNRFVILRLNRSFKWELVVLHATLFMFNKFFCLQGWSWCGDFYIKSFLCCFVEGHTRFGMPRDVENELGP